MSPTSASLNIPQAFPIASPDPNHTGTAEALDDLGWDDHFAAAFESALGGLPPAVAAGAEPARVLRRDRSGCAVATRRGEGNVALASSLKGGDELSQPTTGDFVVISGGEVVAVLERRTSVMRGAFRSLSAQVLAANVDSVLVVTSVASKWRARRLERLLVIAWQTGGVPVVVLTKSDLCDDPEVPYAEARAVSPGASVHLVSAVTGEGIDGLAAELAPRTTSVMIGPSGAGKSTLANALSAGGGHLATQASRADGKGRHTTVTRELVRLANGALMIDTPGLRAIGLWEAEEALGEAFSDIEELAAECRFNDCAHGSEPGCAVTAAISAGHLSGDRLESYKKLEREQQWLAARTDARLRAERTAAFRALSRRVKSEYRR